MFHFQVAWEKTKCVCTYTLTDRQKEYEINGNMGGGLDEGYMGVPVLIL